MSARGRLLLAFIAALLLLAGPAAASPGHHHHHQEAGGAAHAAAVDIAAPGIAGEADCHAHHGASHDETSSCCGVGCSTALAEALNGTPLHAAATRPVPAPVRRVPSAGGDRPYHPPRPAG